jgi:methionyl-tRNA synthetase
MRFYVTTPIYYVNDRPHIGHVYTTTIADIAARFHRLCGDEVFFLTGTDEHAAKVVDSAAEHGVTPQQWADQNAQAFQETFAKLGITNDDFIRTSQPRHKEKAQQYMAELLKTGDVYLGEYEGWYDAGQEEYLPENKAGEELLFSSEQIQRRSSKVARGAAGIRTAGCAPQGSYESNSGRSQRHTDFAHQRTQLGHSRAGG